MSVFTRRRMLTVLAAAAGLPLVVGAGKAEARLVRWQGRALGAPASLALYHHDEAAARRAIDAAVAELGRLEAIFSLYRADSAIARLNRDGRLDAAPAELAALLAEAVEIAALTHGRFDPTIQPVWQAYLQHFALHDSPPAPEALAAARALVGWRGIELDGRTVRLARDGMQVTLNGIAQGWITDRVAEVLRGHGLERMLVDMGEPKALSAKPDGSAWRVGIADPAQPARTVTSVEVVDRAVATSGGYGTTFDGAGRYTHLIDPASGATAPALASVTVIAAKASTADALSTALAVTPPTERGAVLAAAGDVSAVVVGADGAVTTLGA